MDEEQRQAYQGKVEIEKRNYKTPVSMTIPRRKKLWAKIQAIGFAKIAENCSEKFSSE